MDEITKEDAARDFCKRSEESREALFLRAAENLAKRLEGLGFIMDPPVQAGTGTVYLKAKDKSFEVRIADHKESRGTQADRPGGTRYVLFYKGTGASAKKLNTLLSQITARHKK